MKKAIYFMLAVFLMSVAPAMVHAGENVESMSIEEKIAKKMKRLTSELKLTEEQVEQVSALLSVRLRKRKAIIAGQMAKLEAASKDSLTQIQAVLTDKQKTKYAKINGEWEEKEMKSSRK